MEGNPSVEPEKPQSPQLGHPRFVLIPNIDVEAVDIRPQQFYQNISRLWTGVRVNTRIRTTSLTSDEAVDITNFFSQLMRTAAVSRINQLVRLYNGRQTPTGVGVHSLIKTFNLTTRAGL